MKNKLSLCLFILFLITFISACQAQYKVTINIDEERSTSEIVKKGECITIEDPTKEGYDFLGWYYDDAPFDKASPIEKNMTISAKWSPKDCKVIFYIDEENQVEVNYVYDNLVKEIEKPYKEDYIFLGWYKDDEKYDFKSLLKTDIVLKAKFVKDSEYTPELTISFNSTGAKVEIDDVKLNRLDQFDSLPNVTREGYKFLGWYLNDELVENGDIIKEIENFTLIAKWEEE